MDLIKHYKNTDEAIKIVDDYRNKILPVNNKAYANCTRYYLNALIENPEEYETITGNLWYNIQLMQRKDVSGLPLYPIKKYLVS